jgi:magnesium-transporting ATPase (P-type)
MGTSAADEKVHESKHIAFMSSQILNGEGYGIIIRCGDNTFIGKINALASSTKGVETTLQRDITFFVKVVAAIAITMAIVLFSAGMLRKMDFSEAFVNGLVVVLVANIPQGLPATVTSALTLTAERMKDVSVLVKKTDIIESLGSATRIASDKTGTLTQNKMSVMNCWVNRQYRSASDIIASLNKPFVPERVSSKMRGSVGRSDSIGKAEVYGTDDIELQLPPGATKKHTNSKSNSAKRHGTDILSRMSLGKSSAGSAVRYLILY